MEFRIAEVNMDRLEKKLTRIKNKCRKYGCDFTYERVGECFKEIPNPNYDQNSDDPGKREEFVTIKQIIINVDGTAILNDWVMVATVERLNNGNVFKKATDDEIPERYYNSMLVCEHCKTNRPRKMTYIVKNSKTNEFKQVGGSCLCDFCHGRSAEAIANYISAYDELISGDCSEPSGFNFTKYYPTEEFLRYAAETIRHYGYVKTTNEYGDYNQNSTKTTASEFFGYDHGWYTSRWSEEIRREIGNKINAVGFDANSVEARELTEKAVEYVRSMDERNDFIHNLKVLVSEEYVSNDKFGILCCVFPMYNKELEHRVITQSWKTERENELKDSQYVGEIKERITIDRPEIKIISSYETEFGYVYIHKIKDENGNVFIWKSTSGSHDKADKIVGTVKDHSEFRGVKQTVLTRCKVFVA